jgi:hypothetical protein
MKPSGKCAEAVAATPKVAAVKGDGLPRMWKNGKVEQCKSVV